jgi:hypothetical protein
MTLRLETEAWLWLNTGMHSDYQPEQSPYDFIMNPGTPPKKSPLALKVDPSSPKGFLFKIGLIVGGVVVFMIIAAVVVNMLTGDKTNTADITALAQTQAEIVRVSGKANSSTVTNQSLRNFATNTTLTMATQQTKTVALLQTKGIKMNVKKLSLKKDVNIDTELQAASSSNSFDSVFAQIMTKQLNSYTDDLQTYYKNASSNDIKKLLQEDYNQLQLLKTQLPSNLSPTSSNSSVQ